MPKASDSPTLARLKSEGRKDRVAKLNAAIKRQREACKTTIPYDPSKADNVGDPRPATPEETRIAEAKVAEYQKALAKEIAEEGREREREENRRDRELEIEVAMEEKMHKDREEAIEREAERRLNGPPELDPRGTLVD
jgi:hypothetical protein